MKKRILALLLAMAMAFALCACGDTSSNPGSSNNPSSPSSPNTGNDANGSTASGVPTELRVGTSEELGQLLQFGSAYECFGGASLVYDMLFYYDMNDNLASDIITSYSFEDGGYTLVLEVTKDAYFSSGNPVTGEDVLFSLSSTQDPDRQAVVSDFEYFDFDSSYVGDDGYTVYLKTYNTATAVSQFSMLSLVWLIDKKWVEENGWDSELWYTGPSGSGPYGVTDYLTGNTYTFELRDDWWMAGSGKEYPQKVTLTAYSEKTTMFMDLQNGDIDVAIEPTSEDFERAMAEGDNIEGTFINGNVCNWVIFDVEDPSSPTYDIEVRRAIAHGVDWDQVAVAGKGIVWDEATSSLPSYFPDYVNVGKYEYDPALARQILADAGYSDGDIELYMVISVNAQASGPVIQAYLADIGINFTYDALEIASAVPMWVEGAGDISTFAMQGGSVGHDPYWIYKELCSTATMKDNQTVTDTTIDDCLAKALVAETQEDAHQYYEEIQHWIYDNYRLVSYFEEVNAVCYNTDAVASVHFNSRQKPDLRNITFAG